MALVCLLYILWLVTEHSFSAYLYITHIHSKLRPDCSTKQNHWGLSIKGRGRPQGVTNVCGGESGLKERVHPSLKMFATIDCIFTISPFKTSPPQDANLRNDIHSGKTVTFTVSGQNTNFNALLSGAGAEEGENRMFSSIRRCNYFQLHESPTIWVIKKGHHGFTSLYWKSEIWQQISKTRWRLCRAMYI